MRIHFGFPNPDSVERLSPALQALGINLLKAEPSNIPLKGLYRIQQDGYAEYMSNLPAFMYATEINKQVPLGREGYPVITPVDGMFPVQLPPIYITFKGQRDITPHIKAATSVKPISVKDKTLKAYLVEYKPGLLSLIKTSGHESSSYPIANTVSADDLTTLLTILRIVSGFFRTHKYPAFITQDVFEYEFAKVVETSKHEIKADDTDMDEDSDDDAPKKKKMISRNIDGEPTWVKPTDNASGGKTFQIRKAKPSEAEPIAWGAASDIPVTDGIIFPFIEELAIWDKETMCHVISTYFTRCLGHTTDGCLKLLSEICTHWKRSIYRSSIGNVLSHMAKVIEIAIPAQARVFPVFNGDTYQGCYLSGAGYSVALRGDLFRPSSHADNTAEFDCFDSTESILMKILAVCAPSKHKEEEQIAKIKRMASFSMRGLAEYLDSWIIRGDTWETIRILAARIRYPQEYFRINMDNIERVIMWLHEGKDPDKTVPMHANCLGNRSRLASCLAAFGPSAPSPNIPGAQRLSITPKVPIGFNKLLAFRTTSLEVAISDWKELGEKGFVYNGPDRLSGRYQYVQVRGEDERERWFKAMSTYCMWHRIQSTIVPSSSGINLDTLEGAVIAQQDGIDLEGF